MGGGNPPRQGEGDRPHDGGGGPPKAQHSWRSPSTTAPPRSPSPSGGGSFGAAAARLAGQAGVLLGWSPDSFWSATPAELACVFGAMAGEAPAVAGAGDLRRLMEMYPDG